MSYIKGRKPDWYKELALGIGELKTGYTNNNGDGSVSHISDPLYVDNFIERKKRLVQFRADARGC